MSGQYHARERTPVPIEQEGRWAPQAVWTIRRGDKPLAPAGIRTSDRPARNVVTVLITLSWPLCIMIGILVKQRLVKRQGSKGSLKFLVLPVGLHPQ